MTSEEIVRQVIREEEDLREEAEKKRGLAHADRMLIEAELRLTATKIIERLKKEEVNK